MDWSARSWAISGYLTPEAVRALPGLSADSKPKLASLNNRKERVLWIHRISMVLKHRGGMISVNDFYLCR